ncbi:J domain-containing protein [Erythrobacter alti]|uniref:J domain-containing protein n=1 Tax=Erythrobacter alti TaxID=1896145 RepID=UPI0030F41116
MKNAALVCLIILPGGKAMDENGVFVDYYGLLQVNPQCDATMLEKAYRHFAHMYHPDHPDTADVDKFQAILSAYRVLREPDRRAEYDKLYQSHKGESFEYVPTNDDLRIDAESALIDAEMHEKMLYYLYKSRREQPEDPGMMIYRLQRMLDCSDDNFDFHVWYLKSKGLIVWTEAGTLAITIEGVDHVISMSRAAEEKRLQIPKAKKFEEPPFEESQSDTPKPN